MKCFFSWHMGEGIRANHGGGGGDSAYEIGGDARRLA